MVSLLSTRTAAATFSLLILGSMCFGPASAASTVTLSPGDNIQAAVKANPNGTAFLLEAGFYHGQSITAKTGNSFTGQGIVKFMGSDVLSFIQSSNGLWVAKATANNTQRGKCQAAYPLCAYPQDLYVDNVVQTPATTLTDLPAGSWYFDRVNEKVYIASDPTNHTIEIGQLPYAFTGAADNVTISNITVERYGNYAQFGAIGGASTGTGWIVNNAEVRFNHGVGIKLGSNSQVLNSFIHDNGELGITLDGTDSQAVSNEISFNNYAGFALGWEAGGAKFSGTTNLLLKSNYVHDNYGPGLWTDTGNINTTEESNTITNNQSAGIQHELSYAIIIHNNVLSGNGNTPTTWLWNGQISIQNSSNGTIYGNTITVPATNANGIAIINQDRGTDPNGVAYVAENNAVYNNTITYLSSTGATGMVNDTGSHPVLGNSFYANHYVLNVGSIKDEHWCWFGNMDWSNFLATGEEVGGTVVVK